MNISFRLFAAFILSSCVAADRPVVPDTCDEIYLLVLTDYIANAPPEAGAKAFTVTINDEEPEGHDPSQRLFRQLQSRWPALHTRSVFEQKFDPTDHTWGWFAIEIRRQDASSAEVLAWSPYYAYYRYQLRRRANSWRIVTSSIYTPG